MQAITSIPDWIHHLFLDDECFAAAYDNIDAEQRAWLKKNIAQILACYGANSSSKKTLSMHESQGLGLCEVNQPANLVVFFVSESFSSPVRFLAALMPVILSGAREILVVRVRDGKKTSPVPDALLTAMELAGQELVVQLSMNDAQAFIRELPSTTFVLLEGPSDKARAFSFEFSACSRVFSAPAAPKVGMWADGDDAWEWDVFAWAHPDTVCEVWGEVSEEGAGFLVRKGGNIHTFLQEGYDAVFVPSASVELALEKAEIVLGPGQEGGWIWPHLPPDVFRERRFAMYSQTVHAE